MSTEKRPSYSKEPATVDAASDEERNIQSNVDFLRSMEDQEASKKDRRRSGGAAKKEKRSSMPSLALGTKNILAGKFGEAFKRFENNASAPPGPRTPSPLQDLTRRDLTPIAGSEATDDRSDDGDGTISNEANLPPEQRRELERRRLSMEERRVASAAAEYRARLGSGVAPRSIGGVSRATSIQNKVKSLLDENANASPTRKTAEGYGRFTDSHGGHQQTPSQSQIQSQPQAQQGLQSANPYSKPPISRKPILSSQQPQPSSQLSSQPQPQTSSQNPPHTQTRTPILPTTTQDTSLPYAKPRSAAPTQPQLPSKTGGPRPNAPPKPMHLNSLSTGPSLSTQIQNARPDTSMGPPPRPTAHPDMTLQEKEDYIVDFSKRFPSLSGIEMVEREIEGGREGRGKVV